MMAFCLALVGTLLQVRDWYVARRQRMAECTHRWTYCSAWGEGGYWDRRCRDCPKREPVALEDVPAEWRWRERVERNRGACSRRPLRYEGGRAEATASVTDDQPGGELEPIPVEPGGGEDQADEEHVRRRDRRPASDVGGGETVQRRQATRR
jgi:hypothetical protein